MELNSIFFSTIDQAQNSSINWENLNHERKIITGFLKSLKADLIGKGLVYTEQFKILPRSNYFNNTKMQWITSIGVETANFDETLNTFIQLISKTENLIKALDYFKPGSKEDCSQDSLDFFFKLINMKSIIKLSAENGLQQLSSNYLDLGDKIKSTSLDEIGKELFQKVTKLFESLRDKLLKYLPDLKKDLNLEKFVLKGKNLLRKRNRYCADARTVGWAPENGVRIPRLMLIDSRKNVNKATEFNKTAIKSVAEFIKLPSNALALPAQNGSVEWIPLRPDAVNNNEIYFEKGVVGTCERVHHKTEHLCNLYYKIEASLKKITISTGAVDTPLKGKELKKLLLELTAKNELKNNRWILHQLNSITKEKNLVENVQVQAQEIEALLKQEKKDFCLLHVSTAFNVAAKVSTEHSAEAEINIYALAQITEMVKNEVVYFLDKANFDFTPNEWKSFQTFCGEIALFSQLNKTKKSECGSAVVKEEPGEKSLLSSDSQIKNSHEGIEPINSQIGMINPVSNKDLIVNQTKLQEQLKTLRGKIKLLVEPLEH